MVCLAMIKGIQSSGKVRFQGGLGGPGGHNTCSGAGYATSSLPLPAPRGLRRRCPGNAIKRELAGKNEGRTFRAVSAFLSPLRPTG